MNAAKALFFALLLGWVLPAQATVAVPPLVGRVVDLTGTLSTNDVSAMNQTIRAFEARKGSQVAVLIVPSTDGEAIEQFSLRVAEAWKIGRKKIDDGVLLVIAKNDRKLRIEVGYGLEGALTDVTSKRIIDEIITPHFRSGDFAGGISAGVDRIIRIVEGEKLPAPVQSEPSRGMQPSWLMQHIDPFNPFVIFGIFAVGGIMRTLLGRLAGAVVTGSIVGILAWFFIQSLPLSAAAGLIVFFVALLGDFANNTGGGRGSSSSGWSGGSSSSDWSSSSSGSSDSGGGGGSFGGGGASGSW
ncbi:MAG: YgcG family protein [Xanthobacteraceae bacterium]|nr:YgcG family protein [Xanthobacteraceae bacterium]